MAKRRYIIVEFVYEVPCMGAIITRKYKIKRYISLSYSNNTIIVYGKLFTSKVKRVSIKEYVAAST